VEWVSPADAYLLNGVPSAKRTPAPLADTQKPPRSSTKQRGRRKQRNPYRANFRDIFIHLQVYPIQTSSRSLGCGPRRGADGNDKRHEWKPNRREIMRHCPTMLTSDGRLPSVNLSSEPFHSVRASDCEPKYKIKKQNCCQLRTHTPVGRRMGSCHRTAAIELLQH